MALAAHSITSSALLVAVQRRDSIQPQTARQHTVVGMFPPFSIHGNEVGSSPLLSSCFMNDVELS